LQHSHPCVGIGDAVTFLRVASPAPRMASRPQAGTAFCPPPAKAIPARVRHAQTTRMPFASERQTAPRPTLPGHGVRCPDPSAGPPLTFHVHSKLIQVNPS
jgi:hypothetical protein